MATDEKLIQQIKQGKSKAFGQLFRKYQKQVYSICLNIVKNSHDAEEMVQDTFVHAYLKIDQLKESGKFSVWLKKIAENRSKNYLTRKQRELVPLTSATAQTSSQTPDRLLLKQELIDVIMDAIRSLPKKDREMIQARIDGLSHFEISEQFGISISTSTTRLYRIRKRIKARVKELLSTVIGLPNTLSLKKIISGGIVAMKVGTSTKVTIGVIGIIVAGFIGFQVVTHNKTQQVKVKPSERVTQKTVRPKPQHKPVHKRLDESEKVIQDEQYSEEEIEEALAWLDSIGSDEKTEDIQEVAPETEVSKTEDSESTISPELEAIFMRIKDWRDKQRVINRESLPLSQRFAELSRRQQEIYHIINETTGEENQRLQEELRQIRKEKQEVGVILDPFLKWRRDLTEEMKQYAAYYAWEKRRILLLTKGLLVH